MKRSDSLVSVGLPVRNGADRVERVIESVLAQSHENLELVICDNASSDGTEELCRRLAKRDHRIVYHRQQLNVGLLNNFRSTMNMARGAYFRWIGDDDWIAPAYISTCLDRFVADERLVLVTTRIAYQDEHGTQSTDETYTGADLLAEDPMVRLREILRLLNESPLLVDPLYSLVRRVPVAQIARRNMLREDEVFAVKLALAGPWAHVPEVLAQRNISPHRLPALARVLEVPRWQVHFTNTLMCREILGWIDQSTLEPSQRRRARALLARFFWRRQVKTFSHRGRRVVRSGWALSATPEN